MSESLLSGPEPAAPPRGGNRNFAQVLWQRRGLLVFGGIVGAALSLLAYSQRPSVYRSSAQVLVVKKQEANALSVAGGDPRMAVMEDYVATHLIVIRSQAVIGMAVQKLKKQGELKSLQGREPVSTILAGLVAARDPSKDGSGSLNNVLNLSYSGSDPGDVETILAAVIASYEEFLDQTYKHTSEQTVKLIREAADTLTNSLAKKQADYREFRKNSPLIIVNDGDKGVPLYQAKILEYEKLRTEGMEQAEALEKRIQVVQKAIQDKRPREAILTLAQRGLERSGTAAQEQKSNEIALQTSLLPLLAQEADLQQFYGQDHPELVRVRERIRMTKEFHKRLDKIRQEGPGDEANDPVQNVLQSLLLERDVVQMKRTYADELLEKEKKRARDLDANYKEDETFRADIMRLQKVYESTMKRLEEINLVRGYGGFDAKSLAPPGPGYKVSPVLWQFIAMGLMLGVGLAAVAAYGLDLADKSFRTPEEMRRRLGLPIVGHVPYVLAATEPVKTVDAAGNTVELEPGLVAHHQPLSSTSEGFRGIRTALYFSTHAQRHKVIQVTSPNMGDGKTTVITNLAVSMAQSGRKVLLIDADLRRPRVHRVFGLAGKVGLAEVIAGTAELDEAIQVTVVPNLSVLPCGRRPQNPAELLTAPRFEDVLDDVRGAFDYVLIDTPPLLAVSDPCIVAPRTDGLLLTVRMSKNGRPAAERAVDILTGLRVNTVGVVVNGVGKHGSMSGYGYDHYRYADDYTAEYTSHVDEAVAEPVPEASPAPVKSARAAAQEPDGSRPAAEVREERPHVVSKAAVGPSANGHHPHPREAD